MKVLALTPQFLPVLGGIEVFSDALARSLARRSVETTVVTDTDLHGLLPHRETIGDIAVHRLPFLKSLRAQESAASLDVLRRLATLVEDLRPDLIHMHSAVQASAWFVDRLLGKLSRRASFMVTQHGMLEQTDRLGVVRALMLKADMLTAVSEAVLRSAIEFSGRSAGTMVIYNGVQVPRSANAPRTDPPFVLACVGRLQCEKGFDLAIEALFTMRKSGLDASLTIVGQGEERKSLVALAETLGLAPHVRFAGVLAPGDAHDVIAGSNLLLAPSRTREGFGLVVAEAALLGVPCVAARLGGLIETVEEGMTGVLVPPDDPAGLAAAAGALLRDPARLTFLGMTARQRGLDKFDMDKCAAQYFNAYRNLVRT